jgi:NAD(P)-dependent dehydrogenase (short-subunit alcohol dehydrogenase family)
MSAKIAIVAGAGGPVGGAVAAALMGSGLTVVGIDRNEKGLSELPDGIRREVANPVDPAVAGPLIDRIADEVGPPDVLVNTIGTFALGDVQSATPDLLHRMMDINLGPALWLTQAVVPHMQRQGSGVIVHIAARPGLEPTAGMAAYSLSKAALVHLVRTLDVELHPQGIRVNAVAPQVIDTPANRAAFPAEALAGAVAPEAVADVIAYLVSDAAATVSGAIVPTYG